jgi:hypothetical protein
MSWFDKVLNCCKSENRSFDNEKKMDSLKSQGTFGDGPRRGEEIKSMGSNGRSQSPISYNDDYNYSNNNNGSKSKRGSQTEKDKEGASALFGVSGRGSNDYTGKEFTTPVMGSRGFTPGQGNDLNKSTGTSPTAANGEGDQSQDVVVTMRGSLVFNKLPRAPPSNTDNSVKDSTNTTDSNKAMKRDGSMRNVLNSTPIMAPRTKTLKS